MKLWLKLVVAGYIMHACINSLYQDAFGKEGFITLVQFGWQQAKYTVPIAIVAMIGCFVMIFEAKKHINDDNDF